MYVMFNNLNVNVFLKLDILFKKDFKFFEF